MASFLAGHLIAATNGGDCDGPEGGVRMPCSEKGLVWQVTLYTLLQAPCPNKCFSPFRSMTGVVENGHLMMQSFVYV